MKTLVFLAILPHCATCDQVLEFFVRAQTEHFLASAGGVSRAEILVHNIKQFLELVGGATREHCHQFLSDQIRNSTRKCVFLENSRSEEHTSELQSHLNLVCRLLLEKKTHPTPPPLVR